MIPKANAGYCPAPQNVGCHPLALRKQRQHLVAFFETEVGGPASDCSRSIFAEFYLQRCIPESVIVGTKPVSAASRHANSAFVYLQLAPAARLVRHDDWLEGWLQERLVLRKAGSINPGDRVLNDEPGILDRAREPVPCARAAECEQVAAGL